MNRLPLAPIGAKDDWFTFFYRALVPKGTIKHAWIAICCREKKIGTAEKKISTAGNIKTPCHGIKAPCVPQAS
ncbi:hypothetical protein [Breznakibacter xylanolyticus]|uniref:hypothetical protein n=1 Tax=Breznakibacter xylanolyticus TaxID=990 RepID=UPI0011B3AA38|nr:hypothetical protein [Breznakibacter xylanolyticus]